MNGYSLEEWESFLCLSKKCRENREKKRSLRNEKKALQNEERKADIERVRAETGALTSLGPSSPIPPRNPFQNSMESISIEPTNQNQSPVPPKNNPILYLAIGGGVLLLGGIAFFIIKKKRAVA